MPRVEQQRAPATAAKAKPKTGGSVLDRITPVQATTVGRLRFAIYGAPKTGKTRFAATFPKPMLFIGTEDGTASIAGVKDVDLVMLEKTEEIFELIEMLRGGKYASVALDTATKLRDMRIAEILNIDKPPNQKSFGYASRDVYIQAAGNMKDMIVPLMDLPRRMDINVVVISHEQNFTPESAAESDVIQPKISCALGESLARFVCGEADYVCQSFIRDQTVVKKVKVGNSEQEQRVRTGKREFCLRTEPHSVYEGGIRVPLGCKPPPDALVDPTYDKFVRLLQAVEK